MKIRSILFALAAFALAVPALAQDAPEAGPVMTLPEAPHHGVELEPTPRKNTPSLMEEQEYFWGSRHFTRRGLNSQGNPTDSNTIDLFMPHALGNPPSIEIRGYGQIFAPGIFWTMFGSLATNSDSSVWDDPVAYYEQFKNARGFTIDQVEAYWYKNPNGSTPLAGATFYLYGAPTGMTDAYFNGNTYKTRGFRVPRQSMPVLFEAEITPEGIDTTLGDNTINPTAFVFDPPLVFEAGKFAVPFFVNDEAEAVSAIAAGDIRDFQIMRAFWNRRSGTQSAFGSNTNNYKALGLLIFRPYNAFDPQQDTIHSLAYSLQFDRDGTGPIPPDLAILDNWFQFYGTVDINASVRYHYGRDAKSAGLSSPTPNPVSSNTRVPFSITEITNVRLELFDINGAHIRTITDQRYVPGNYSAELNVDDLDNGTYLVRMTAGESMYSIKVTVAK